MNLHDFIFSNSRWYRVSRHICFWLGWFLFSGIVQISFTGKDISSPVSIMDMIFYQFVRSMNRLPGLLLFCYFIVYFLVPRFTKKQKIIQLIFLLLLSVISSYIITFGSLFLSLDVLHINPFIQHWPAYVYFFNSYYSFINFTGAIPTCCLMIAIKYYKDWSIKQRRSEQLGRENIQAELQLLKAQVHPHFLFNTLNNIYSFVLTKDNRAARLVDKLAGMIDYMRTEGENSLVPLEKEIRLIKDYMGLEKVRYGDRLDLKVGINGEDQNRLIAPLLMIPFVENCFKHGASIMRGQQWIRLVININNDQLDFNLSNSKPSQSIGTNNKKGIGLANVQKRLQLLYPGKHFLKIESTDDAYVVHLQLSLQQVSAMDREYIKISKPQPA